MVVSLICIPSVLSVLVRSFLTPENFCMLLNLYVCTVCLTVNQPLFSYPPPLSSLHISGLLFIILKFLYSILRPLQYQKTSKKTITAWYSNKMDKPVPDFTAPQYPNAIQFPTSLIPETWHNWDLGPDVILLPKPFIIPSRGTNPIKWFHYEWWWNSRILVSWDQPFFLPPL